MAKRSWASIFERKLQSPQRAPELDLLRVEAVRPPSAQPGQPVLRVVPVLQGLDAIIITRNSATILRRPGQLAGQADRIFLSRFLGIGPLEKDVVLPVVAVIVGIKRPVPRTLL
jgi:hypothetical protein